MLKAWKTHPRVIRVEAKKPLSMLNQNDFTNLSMNCGTNIEPKSMPNFALFASEAESNSLLKSELTRKKYHDSRPNHTSVAPWAKIFYVVMQAKQSGFHDISVD